MGIGPSKWRKRLVSIFPIEYFWYIWSIFYISISTCYNDLANYRIPYDYVEAVSTAETASSQGETKAEEEEEGYETKEKSSNTDTTPTTMDTNTETENTSNDVSKDTQEQEDVKQQVTEALDKVKEINDGKLCAACKEPIANSFVVAKVSTLSYMLLHRSISLYVYICIIILGVKISSWLF